MFFTIINLSPDLAPFTTALQTDEATVRTVLNSWGPGKFDAALLLDGKAFRPDGKSGATLMPAYGRITEAMRRHRVATDRSDRFVERLLGLNLTQAQYDRGNTFVAGVVERSGDTGLARLWTDAAHLPTPAEVDAPGLWLARIDLPAA